MTEVLEDPEDVADVLHGTELDGLPVEEGLGDTLVITGLDPGRLLPAWQVARAALGRTGRWPVLTRIDEQWQDVDAEQASSDMDAIDPWTIYRWTGFNSRIPPEEAHLWLPDFLDFPDPSLELSLATVERATWERLLADPVALDQAQRRADHLVGTGQWFTPPGGAQLVLLPTPVQWLAPAWLDYHGATEKAARPDLGDDPGRRALAAAIREWEREWGAELVASWGTMLQFVTTRRPALGEPAWQLALQHLAVGGSLESPPWELALALTRSDAWFLHDRP